MHGQPCRLRTNESIVLLDPKIITPTITSTPGLHCVMVDVQSKLLQRHDGTLPCILLAVSLRHNEYSVLCGRKV